MWKERLGVTFLVLAALAIPVTAGMSACAATSRNKTLVADVAVLDAADAAATAYEHQHAEATIAAENGPQLQADIAAFRAKMDKVHADIDGGYRLAAKAGAANDSPSLTTLEAALTALHTELVTIGVLK